MGDIISYFLVNLFFYLFPFIMFSGFMWCFKDHSRKKWQIIVFCLVDFAFSAVVYYIYQHDLQPHLFDDYTLRYAFEYHPTLVSILDIIAQVIHWGKIIVLYIVLKKRFLVVYETEEYKLQALRDAEKKLEEENKDNFDKYPWYTVGKDMPADDVTVIRTAEPAFISVDTAEKTYRISVLDKKEYIVVRDGEKYRPFNCYFKDITPPKYEQPKTSGKIDDAYILPEVSKQTTEASTEEMKDSNDMSDIKPSSSADDNPSQIVSNGEPKTDENIKNIAQQAIDDYINEKKEQRKKIIKFAVPFVAFALVCVAIVAGIAHYYSTTYSDNLRAQLRDEVWHEAFNAGYDAARK